MRRTERPVLPIPYSYRLVVRARQYPGQLMVKEYGPHIVQVAIEGEQTPPRLVRPHFDFVIVAAGHKEWLGFVKVYASYWAIVLLKSVNQCAHTIVPQLDCRGMQGDQNPRPAVLSAFAWVCICGSWVDLFG